MIRIFLVDVISEKFQIIYKPYIHVIKCITVSCFTFNGSIPKLERFYAFDKNRPNFLNSYVFLFILK